MRAQEVLGICLIVAAVTTACAPTSLATSTQSKGLTPSPTTPGFRLPGLVRTATPTPDRGIKLATTATPDSALIDGANEARISQQWTDEIHFLEKLLNRNPDSVTYKLQLYQAHVSRGLRELSDGNKEAARQDFTVAKELLPDRQEAQQALASLGPAISP